jgi:putative membrane protein
MSENNAAARTEPRTELRIVDALAFERTGLAYERTMMGWIRTAASLMTFGFALYKFFQFDAVRHGLPVYHGLLSPRRFSLVLIALSVICLALAAVSHRRSLQAMRAHGVTVPYSTAVVLGLLVAILRVAVFFAV